MHINIVQVKDPAEFERFLLQLHQPKTAQQKEKARLYAAMLDSSYRECCDLFGVDYSESTNFKPDVDGNDYKIHRYPIHKYDEGIDIWYFDLAKKKMRITFYWFM